MLLYFHLVDPSLCILCVELVDFSIGLFVLLTLVFRHPAGLHLCTFI